MSNPLPPAVKYGAQAVMKAVDEQKYEQSAAGAIRCAIGRESL